MLRATSMKPGARTYLAEAGQEGRSGGRPALTMVATGRLTSVETQEDGISHVADRTWSGLLAVLIGKHAVRSCHARAGADGEDAETHTFAVHGRVDDLDTDPAALEGQWLQATCEPHFNHAPRPGPRKFTNQPHGVARIRPGGLTL